MKTVNPEGLGAIIMTILSAFCLMQAPETPEKLIQGAGVTALLALVWAVLRLR